MTPPEPTDPGHLPPEPLVPSPVGVDPPNSLQAWVKVNGWKLAIMAAVIGFVCWKFYWLDVLLAGLGLSGIIFLHELGHFLAAKLCNVYVRTFSIGFGPAWPFCQFKYGETNYKLGMIPLGGYVAMAGEPTGEVDPDAVKDDVDDDTDPRSFKNRPVWQRMIIISAGVVMNVLLAAVCFIVVYSAGVKEMPPVVQGVEPGSAAWQAGLRPGMTIEQINGIERPTFGDIPPEVSSAHKGATVHVETVYQGTPAKFDIEPLVAEGGYYPQFGLSFPQGVQLAHTKRDPLPPYSPDTPADHASRKSAAEGPAVRPGDTVAGMSDPADPDTVTPLDPEKYGPGGQFDYRRRLSALAGKDIKVELQRLDSAERVMVTIPAAFRQDTGLRMKIGQIAAVRAGSAAEKAGFATQKMDGEKILSDGDVITKVTAPDGDGRRTLFDPADPKANDPLRLPFELNNWAKADEKRTVSVTVQPAGGGAERTVELAWDDSFREDGFLLGSSNTPLPLGGLGLAYRVTNEVAYVVPGSPAMPQPEPPPAAESETWGAVVGGAVAAPLADTQVSCGAVLGGAVAAPFGRGVDAERTRQWRTRYLQPGDKVTEVRFNTSVFKQDGGRVTADAKPGNWDKVKGHHWAYVDYKLQVQPPHTFEYKADRNGVQVEGTIAAAPDAAWGVPWTGLTFARQTEVLRATDAFDALRLGTRRTVRSIKQVYQNLSGMAMGRISPLTMSGPITLAETGYQLAGEDFWTLVLFLGLISVNLAVVNFLPIPVLDGGHMVFLIYEAVFRRPAPVWVQNWLTLIGLVMVLCLMLFTIGLDIYKHFFMG